MFHWFLAFQNSSLLCICTPAMPLTSNKSFLDWGEGLHDPVPDPYTSGYSALARMDHRKTGNPTNCITATCSIRATPTDSFQSKKPSVRKYVIHSTQINT